MSAYDDEWFDELEDYLDEFGETVSVDVDGTVTSDVTALPFRSGNVGASSIDKAQPLQWLLRNDALAANLKHDDRIVHDSITWHVIGVNVERHSTYVVDTVSGQKNS